MPIHRIIKPAAMAHISANRNGVRHARHQTPRASPRHACPPRHHLGRRQPADRPRCPDCPRPGPGQPLLPRCHRPDADRQRRAGPSPWCRQGRAAGPAPRSAGAAGGSPPRGAVPYRLPSARPGCPGGLAGPCSRAACATGRRIRPSGQRGAVPDRPRRQRNRDLPRPPQRGVVDPARRLGRDGDAAAGPERACRRAQFPALRGDAPRHGCRPCPPAGGRA